MIKFILITHERSGSHMLASALAQHPSLWFEDREPFLKENNLNYLIELYNQSFLPKVKAVGCMSHWFLIRNTNGMERYLFENKDIHIIHLYRQKLLDRVASHKIGNRCKIYRTSDENYCSTMTIKISPFEMYKHFVNIQDEYERIKLQKQLHPSFTINYEDFCNNINGWLSSIQNFLGVPYTIITPTTVKMEKRNINEIIENYYSLKKCFEGTSLEKEFYI